MNTIPTPSILNCLRLPARLNSEQAAVRLGLEVHDIPVLIRSGLLKPLGSPRPNAPKKFAAIDIEEHAADVAWLSRATKTLSAEWARKKADRFHSKKDL